MAGSVPHVIEWDRKNDVLAFLHGFDELHRLHAGGPNDKPTPFGDLAAIEFVLSLQNALKLVPFMKSLDVAKAEVIQKKGCVPGHGDDPADVPDWEAPPGTSRTDLWAPYKFPEKYVQTAVFLEALSDSQAVCFPSFPSDFRFPHKILLVRAPLFA